MNKFFLFAGIIFLLSCNKESITGSGPSSNEVRNAANFTEVDISGSSDVFITRGTAFRVEVQGYSNLLPYFETEVDGGTLYLHFRNYTSVRNNNIKVYVTMPALEEVSTSGSSKAEVTGGFVSDRLEAHVSGSGEIRFQDGTANLFLQRVSGSGKIRAFALVTDRADISVSGSGKSEVNVTTNLKAHVSGSGSVWYKGTPSVESSVSGSGKVERKV